MRDTLSQGVSLTRDTANLDCLNCKNASLDLQREQRFRTLNIVPPSMDIEIREYQENDRKFVEKLQREHLLASAPKTRLADVSDAEKLNRMLGWYNEKIEVLQHVPICRTYIATDKTGKQLGYVIVMAEAKDDFRPERQGFLCDLAIEEAYWGSGVAQALIEAAEHYAKRMGHEFMMLNVSAFNERAVEFYRKLGYVEEWKMMGKRLQVERETGEGLIP